MIPPGQFPPPPPGLSPYAPPRADDEAVPTPRAPALAPWAPAGAPEQAAPTPWTPALDGSATPAGVAASASGPDAPSNPLERAVATGPWVAPPTPGGWAALPDQDHAAHPLGQIGPSAPGFDSTTASGSDAATMGAAAPADARRRADRRWLLVGAAGGLMSAAMVAAAVITLLVRPWVTRPTRAPTAITSDFAQVERWAKGPPPNERHADVLTGAATLVARQTARVGDGEVPRIETSALTVDERAALEALLKWHDDEGGFISAGCAPRREAVGGDPTTADATATATGGDKPVAVAPPEPDAYLVLGGLGLVTSAGKPEQIQGLEATLALADALRLRGDLREHATGVRLAVLAARWTQARKYTVSPRFESHRPRVEHFRGALARATVCALERLGPDGGWSFSAGRLVTDDGPRPPLGLLWAERERLVVKDFVGHWLASTRDARTVDEVVDRLAAAPPPASVTLRAAVPPVETLRTLAKDYAEYDRLLPPQRSARRREPASSDRRSRGRRPATPPPAAASIRKAAPDRKTEAAVRLEPEAGE